MANNKDLIIKALENNLPMEDIYAFKGHSKSILSQSGQLLSKFEPIINEITDSAINIPCLLSKLNEKTLCSNPDSMQCNISKTNRELTCKPMTVFKNKFEPFLQCGGKIKITKDRENIKIYKEIYKKYCI